MNVGMLLKMTSLKGKTDQCPKDTPPEDIYFLQSPGPKSFYFLSIQGENSGLRW